MIALYRPPRANAEVYNFVNNGISVCVVRVDDESYALGAVGQLDEETLALHCY